MAPPPWEEGEEPGLPMSVAVEVEGSVPSASSPLFCPPESIGKNPIGLYAVYVRGGAGVVTWETSLIVNWREVLGNGEDEH